MTEAWFYDGATRALMDENRLTVARDVNPNDAATILAALRGPHGAFADIVADMLAYEAEKFDAEPVYDVWEEHLNGDRKIRDGVSAAEVAELRAANPGQKYWTQEFEAADLDVSGADLVDAFTQWREQLKAATREGPAGD